MERDRSIGTYISPGIKEGEKEITHFLIQAKQTIRFNEDEADNYEEEIFSTLKNFNCQIFTNLRGVDILEEEIIETKSYDDPQLEKVRKKLVERVVDKTVEAYQKLERNFKEE